MKDTDELSGEKTWKGNEKWEGLCGYATCLTPVISFHYWNRPWKMAGYSLARKRFLRGWKCPAMGAISRKKALRVFG